MALFPPLLWSCLFHFLTLKEQDISYVVFIIINMSLFSIWSWLKRYYQHSPACISHCCRFTSLFPQFFPWLIPSHRSTFISKVMTPQELSFPVLSSQSLPRPYTSHSIKVSVWFSFIALNFIWCFLIYLFMDLFIFKLRSNIYCFNLLSLPSRIFVWRELEYFPSHSLKKYTFVE